MIFVLKVMAFYSDNDLLQRSLLSKFLITCSLCVTVFAGRFFSLLLQ